MLLSAHLAAGLLCGKFLGNYPIAIAGAVFIDVDHLIPYYKNNILFHPKKIYKALISRDDPYGDQRNILHNVFTWIILSVIWIFFDSQSGVVFAAAYFTHLLLDALDSSDFQPFLPFSIDVRGPIKYFSLQESFFTIILFCIFFLI